MARSTARMRLAKTRFAAHAAMPNSAARLATLFSVAAPLNLSSTDPAVSHGTSGNSTTAATAACPIGSSPADELPDLRQAGGLVGAHLAENHDRPLQVGHGLHVMAGGVM